MIDIKSALGLAKHIINCKVIATTNYYQIAMGRISYLNTIVTKIPSKLVGS